MNRYDLSIQPGPASQVVRSDEWGNDVVHVAFEGQTSELTIESRFEAVTEVPPRLHDPGWPRLPWARRDGVPTSAALPPPVDGEVAAFAFDLAEQADYRPLAFLDRLTRTLYERTDRQIRLEGAAQTAVDTLRSRRGACRDLTVLFLEACRALGLSGRFVSGYQAAADTSDGQRHLHAWPEVHLPEVGWRGWDATHGVEVGDGHVPLCAAPTQARTMPVEGGFSFAGSMISSELRYRVHIETVA
jgi:transglutaminase-like putative cysteine protease